MLIYKGYQIKPYKSAPKTYIVTIDGHGGSAPECLRGMYTSPQFAKYDIDRYLDKPIVEEKPVHVQLPYPQMFQKGTKNGKASGKG